MADMDRFRIALLAGAVCLAFAAPAAAQSSPDQKPAQPADQQMTPEQQAARDAQRRSVEEFTEAARLLPGTAGLPECVWTGRRIASLLWRDDIDTARRHLDLYEKFGCPTEHLKLAFRCLVRQGNIDPKTQEKLTGRVQQCWVNPDYVAAPAQ